MPQDVNPLLDRLIEAFPACFSRTAPQPLKIGLGEELLALAGVHPALAGLTRTQLRRALKVYTRTPAYRKALARGGPRYDLAGQPDGEVTPEQRAVGPPAPPDRRLWCGIGLMSIASLNLRAGLQRVPVVRIR